MNWVEEYRRKRCTAEEAVALVKSGDHVYYGGNAAIPKRLVEALAGRYRELRDVELTHVLLLGDDPLSRPEREGHFRHNSWCDQRCHTPARTGWPRPRTPSPRPMTLAPRGFFLVACETPGVNASSGRDFS